MAVAVPTRDDSCTNTTAYASDARQAPYELVRSDRFEQLIRRMSFPESYIVNTKRESGCILFVETFRSQFAQLFPSRPPLLLSPLNECNTSKFISSFVRPSQVKHAELYNYDTCAKFVANFVVYEPLEEMERVPQRIVSPATVLEWQVANSVELSITLCSLLCGSGYNAYVVVGRASRDIVDNNRSQTPWEGVHELLPVERNSDDDEPAPPEKNNRFWRVMKRRPKLESGYDTEMAKDGAEDELYMMSRARMQAEGTLRGTINFGGGTMDFGSDNSGGLQHGARSVTGGMLSSQDGNNTKNNNNGNTMTTGAAAGAADQQDEEDNARNISPYVHAWVMILPSSTSSGGGSGGSSSKKRPVQSVICIEPATGLEWTLDDESSSRYQSVETVFNHINCFVNMTPNRKPCMLKWDLYDLERWESVFLTDAEIIRSTGGDGDGVGDGAGGASAAGAGSRGVGSGGKFGAGASQSSSKSYGHHHSLGGSKTGSAAGGGGNPAVGIPDMSAAIEAAAWSANDGGDLSLDLPASWVAPLTLSAAQLANRYPRRRITIQYADALVTHFSEYADPELRVLEVRVQDDLDPRAQQVHTLYKHRQDLLRRKSMYPSLETKAGGDPLAEPRKAHEWFLSGRKVDNRTEGLRELIVERGKQRIMRFYWRSRDDGLARRTELWAEGDRSEHPLPRKIIEEYKGRESTDFLTYRSATFKPVSVSQPGGSIGVGGAGGGGGGFSSYSDLASHVTAAVSANKAGSGSSGMDGRSSDSKSIEKESISLRPPERMAEKFARDPRKNAEDDIMKIKYIKPTYNTEGEIWVHYHYPADCITFPYRQFPKSVERDRADSGSGAGGASQSSFADESSKPVVVTASFQSKPREPELREQLRRLLGREKECLNEIRQRIDDCHVIRDQRIKDKKLLAPIMSSYDTLRNRNRVSAADLEKQREEELRRQQSRNDYLAPYIAALDVDKSLLSRDISAARLTVENAKLVRDAALKDLKDRLIQRGHIMQARLDHEKEDLYRKQAQFQKTLDASNEGAADSEAFARFCSDAAWRMKILDERLSRHIEDAGNRYAALARKLSEDTRLAALYENA